MAKVKVKGKQRPFYKGTLHKIGDTIDVDKKDLEKGASWMGGARSNPKPVASRPQAELTADE